jgi:DNA replication protein DnaC
MVNCLTCGNEATEELAWCKACIEERWPAEAAYRGIAPSYYRDIKPSKLPYPGASAKVLGWFIDDDTDWCNGKPGLLLCGPPGCGKTFTAYETLRRQMVYTNSKSALAYRGTAWAREVVRQSRGDDYAAWLDEHIEADFLLLDDFDKMKFTPKVAEAFYEILEARFTESQLTILTCNVSGEKLGTMLPEEHGQAAVRRLREFCTLVEFGSE